MRALCEALVSTDTRGVPPPGTCGDVSGDVPGLLLLPSTALLPLLLLAIGLRSGGTALLAPF